MRFNHSDQSRSFTERRRRRVIVGIISAIVAIISWVFVFSRISFLPFFAIDQIEVYGVDTELAMTMNASATKAMDGAYIGLFSKANTLIYPRVVILENVASSSPRVDNVTIKRSGLNKIIVSISEKSPAAIVCADLPDLSDGTAVRGDNCYAVDDQGLIFRRVIDSDPKTYDQFYVPDLAGRELLGTYATSTDKFRTLLKLVGAIKVAGIKVEAILIKDGHQYELYALNPTGSSIVVIQMDDRAGLDEERENLIAFWTKMVRDSKINGTNLEWSEIKVQFPPNVYSRRIEDDQSQ